MKKYFAEFVGTWLFSLAVALSLAGKFPVATPVIAALTLGLFVYTIGSISGAHLNPAVTIGLWTIKKIATTDAVKYIIAQFLGAGATYFLAPSLAATASLTALNSAAVGSAEFFGAIIFMFGIAAVVYGKVPVDASGATVGGSLLIGLSLAAAIGSNAVLNPAMALAIGSFSWLYVLAPIAGSIAGMNLYKWLVSERN